MEKTPRQNRIREALGKIYENEPPHFREYLQRFRQDPNSRVFAPLAEAYRRMGRVEEAIEICRSGLKAHPDFHGGRVALAKCLMDKKYHQEARSELELVVQSSPQNLLAQKLLGDLCLSLSDKKNALHAYKMALLLAPQDVHLNEKVKSLETELNQDSASLDTQWVHSPMMPMQLEEEIPSLSLDLADTAPRNSITLPNFDEEEEELFSDVERRAGVDSILGATEGVEDTFKIEHISQIFDEKPGGELEITTETLAELYFSQGQYEKALRIYERVLCERPSPSLQTKISECQKRLGVDEFSKLRSQKIDLLKGILHRVQSAQSQKNSLLP